MCLLRSSSALWLRSRSSSSSSSSSSSLVNSRNHISPSKVHVKEEQFYRSEIQTVRPKDLLASLDLRGEHLVKLFCRIMSSEVEPRVQRLSAWFDLESVAVVTILLGLFQVLLSVPLAFANLTLTKFFVLPLVLGILIVAGGSFIIANERNSSRLLLQGCACSNVVGLLGALLAFCLYCYSLSITHREPCEQTFSDHYSMNPTFSCPKEILTAYSWSVTLLLLLYDCGAVVVLSLLSVCSFRALNTH